MKVKLTKRLKIVLLIVVVLIGGLYYMWYQDDIGAHGRLYPSKQKMCIEFAQSYLRTIQEVENIDDFGRGVWNRVIAIESDLYNLCQLELTDEALENYKTTNIQRYLDEYRNR